VAPAVAAAAIKTGVARIEIDQAAYRNRLEARLGRRREVMRDFILKAQRNPRSIVYPEGENDRIIRAAAQVVEERIAHPILLGRADRIRKRAESLHVDLAGITITEHWMDEQRRERYAQKLYHMRHRKGVTLDTARELIRNPTYFGCMMVREGDADGLIAGQEVAYPETIRPALEVIGTVASGKHVAGLYMMVLQHDLVFFADTTVNIDPDAGTLAEITLLTAQFVRRLGIEPHVALLSFSNFGSARHAQSDKVRS
jgi:malate dehydrogenase (oxaloacetate-decarboxylating)(NADP+)